MDSKRNVTSIQVCFDNGDVENITRGLAISFKEGKDDTYKAKFLPCNISGAEMEMIVNSVIALGNVIGMFDGEE